MAVAQTSAQKQTQLRVQRALAKPGAFGKKGFLLWAEAAFPPALVKPVLDAAAKYVPGAGMPITLASPQSQGFQGYASRGPYAPRRSLGYFGDDSMLSDVTVSIPDITEQTTQAINAAADPSVPPVSAVTAATDSQPASSSWVSDLSKAFTAASTAALGIVQVQDAQKIFNTNLSRAQQGLSMIPSNPTQYGLPSPTANIGLTSGTQTALMIGIGILAVALIGGGLASGRSKS